MKVQQIPSNEAPRPRKHARVRPAAPPRFQTLVRQKLDGHPEVAEGTPSQQYQAIRDELMLCVWQYVPDLLARQTKFTIRHMNGNRRRRSCTDAGEVVARTGSAVFTSDQLEMPVTIPREGIKPIGQLRGREFFRVARALGPAAVGYRAYVELVQRIADGLAAYPDLTLEQAIAAGHVSAAEFAAWIGNIREFKLPEQEEDEAAATF